jgi:hypothetical protein
MDLLFAAIAFYKLEIAIGVLTNNSDRLISFKANSLDWLLEAAPSMESSNLK